MVNKLNANDFEKEVLASGETQRDIGLLFVIVSLMLLGIALFSTLIHIKNTKIIWVFGGVVLFAGCYFAYSADGTPMTVTSCRGAVVNATMLVTA